MLFTFLAAGILAQACQNFQLNPQSTFSVPTQLASATATRLYVVTSVNASARVFVIQPDGGLKPLN